MPEPFFASAYMRLLYRFLRLDEAREARLLGDTGVTADQLLSPDPQIPFSVQMQLCRNALAMEVPGLGLQMGAQLQLAAHGSLGTAMQNGEHLGEALAVFAKYVATRASFFSLEIVTRGEQCVLLFGFDRLDGDLVPFFTESILSTLNQCVAFYVGSNSVEKRVELAYPEPGYADHYVQALGVRPRFAAGRTAMSFSSKFLTMSTHDPDREAFADAIHRCRIERKQQTAFDTAGAAVRSFLRENPGQLWGVDDVARSLHISRRTLIRRLSAEETTYQAIRDEVLKGEAANFLRSMTVATTAAALGFADESSFRRSFRRWYGVSPGDFKTVYVD